MKHHHANAFAGLMGSPGDSKASEMRAESKRKEQQRKKEEEEALKKSFSTSDVFQKSLVFKYKTALRGNWKAVPKSLPQLDSEEFMKM